MCAWEEEPPVDDQCGPCFSLRAEICQWLLLLSPLSLWLVTTTTTAVKVLPLAMVLRIFKTAL